MNRRPMAKVQYDNGDRVVIVTGGASGIGREICLAFLRSGANVVCADIKTNSELPAEIHFIQADTSSASDCQRIVQWTVENLGGLDVLVNNAAIQPTDSYVPIEDYSLELWQRMVDVNLTGYALMAKFALPVMKSQRSGVVVNLASGQGHRTTRGVPAYGPIKAANIMQARQWAIEYARKGVRVVSVSPGAIDTPMVRATLAEQGGEAELANRHPLGRIGHPAEIASAVLWLSSDDASFVTGTDLEVDGGLGAFGSFADPF